MKPMRSLFDLSPDVANSGGMAKVIYAGEPDQAHPYTDNYLYSRNLAVQAILHCPSWFCLI